MELVDKIKKGDKTRNGTVRNPDKIIKMGVLADEKKAE
jgi:peptidylprolyl isomerase